MATAVEENKLRIIKNPLDSPVPFYGHNSHISRLCATTVLKITSLLLESNT